MWRAAFICIALLAAGAHRSASAQTPKDDAELHAATRQLATTIRDAFEEIYLLPAPLYVEWPDKAGRPRQKGALVLFSLEGRNGGNSYSFYIAHYQHRPLDEVARDTIKREWMNYRLTDFAQVGGKFWQSLTWDSAATTDDGIVVPTQPWLRNDAGCCPTGRGAIRLDIDHNGRLSVTDVPVQ